MRLRDGDMVVFDIKKRRLDGELSDDEIKARMASSTAPPPRYATGALAKYARSVASASLGALTSRQDESTTPAHRIPTFTDALRG